MQPEHHDCQTTAEKIICTVTGLFGMSLSFAQIATFAQQVGAIVGCLLVCAQAIVALRKWWRARKMRNPVNDR